jgi:hypothetical protein
MAACEVCAVQVTIILYFCYQKDYEKTLSEKRTSIGRRWKQYSVPGSITGPPCDWRIQIQETGPPRLGVERRADDFLTHAAEPFLRSRRMCRHSRTSQHFGATRRFITVFTRALHWSLSWARSIQSIPSHPILSLNIHFNISHPPTMTLLCKRNYCCEIQRSENLMV